MVRDTGAAGMLRVPMCPARDRDAASDALLSPREGNLPTPLSTFVGRHRELERLTAMIVMHRLVSVVGPGGSGKTRLALEALGSLRHPEMDGPWIVELAGIEDVHLIARPSRRPWD